MPLTAIESPGFSSSASRVRTRRRAPSPSRSTAPTTPRSPIRPVNISSGGASRGGLSPLAQPGGDQDVVADLLAVECQRTHRLRYVLDATALQGVARGAAAQEQRREEQPDLVDLLGVQKRARQVRAALEKHRSYPLRAELVERRADARGLVLAGGHHDLHPGRFQGVGI